MLLVLNLGGCYVPVLNREITVPFLEKNSDTALKLSLEALKKMQSYSYSGSFGTTIELEDKTSFLTDEVKENLLSLINEGSPKVLGIDNETEINNINPLPVLNSFPKKISINYKIKGKVDQTNKDDLKNNFDIQITIDMGGMSFDIELSVVTINEVVYIKFAKTPPFIDLMLKDLGINMGDVWWKFDTTNTGNLTNDIGAGISVSLARDLINKERTIEIRNKLVKSIEKYPILKIEERLKDQKIDKEKYYNYKSSIDFASLIKLADEVNGILEDEEKNKTEKLEKDNLNENSFNNILEEIKKEQQEKTKKMINEIPTMLKKSDVLLWINKKSFEMRKISYDLMFDTGEAENGILSNNKAIIKVKGEIDYLDVNKKVEISAPEKSEDFYVIILQKLEEAKIKSRDAKRVSDIKQIQTALELYYSDNEVYPENLNFLLSDGAQELEENFWSSNIYLFDLPKDPKPNNECGEEFEYKYILKNEGQDFDLGFCLEAELGKYQKGENLFNSMVSSSSRVEMIEANNDFQGVMLDSDNDGLNDFEEEMIYFTDMNNPDTDGDGFSDGDEVKNGYSPSGDGKLNGECSGDFDCEKYISYNTCEVLCINRKADKNSLGNGIDCDSVLWEPSLESDCGCVDKKCILN